MGFNCPLTYFTTESDLFQGIHVHSYTPQNQVIYCPLWWICTSLIYCSLSKTLPIPLIFLQDYLISTFHHFTLENLTITYSDLNFCHPLQITSPHLLSLDVNWLNIERKIILCCSGSSFSEHTPRTLAPKLFLFANQQPASNPPTHLMVGERWQKGEEKKLGREERESNDQYLGPLPTWIISLPLFRTCFPFAACMHVCVCMFVGGRELHDKLFSFLILLSHSPLEITLKL